MWRIILGGVLDGIMDLIDVAWLPAIAALSVNHFIAHDEYARAGGSFIFFALTFAGLRLRRIEYAIGKRKH